MVQCILVAEDDHVLASDLCETVEEAGYEVEGPHVDIDSALRASQQGRPDLAILDITQGNDAVFSLADTLTLQNIPIIFHSGVQAAQAVSARFPGATTLTKPCPPAAIIGALSTALATRPRD